VDLCRDRPRGRGMTVLVVHPPRRLVAIVLGGAIVLGSLTLWIGIPVGWLWVASRLSSEYPIVWALAVFGAPLTMAAWTLVLARLNVAYLRATEAHPGQQHAAWLHSMSGERSPRRPRRALLDVSKSVSVVLALLALMIWFFFFAENYSPGRVL
jgi:hypothetical protein